MKRFSDRIRAELIHICGAQLPLTMKPPSPGAPMDVRYELAVDKQLSISCHLGFDWQAGLHERSANLRVGAQFLSAGRDDEAPAIEYRPVGVAVIQEAEDEAATLVTNELANLVGRALDRIEGGENSASLHGLNLQDTQESQSLQLGDNQ